MVLYEGKMLGPTKKMVDPRVEFMLPINIRSLKSTCALIVYENQDAIIHSVDDMRMLHKIHFTPSYDVKVSNEPVEEKKDTRIIKRNINSVTSRKESNERRSRRR